MSNVEDRLESVMENQMLEERYQKMRAKIERNRLIEDGQAGAMVFAALAYGDALDEHRSFRLVSHWAKLFCIAAVFVIPNLLVIHVLL